MRIFLYNIYLAALLLPSLAQAETLLCKVKLRLENYSEKKVSVAPGSSTMYEDVENFRFKLNNLGNSKFEIEVYDGAATTRSYTSATLKTPSDELAWSFWSRENLIESSCELTQ